MNADQLQLIILPAGLIAIALRALPGPGRAAARHGHPGDGGRRGDDLRGRRRVHPPPVHDDRHPRRSSGPSSSARSSRSSRPRRSPRPTSSGSSSGSGPAIAFLVGAACSMASGIIGMYISVKANVRTASAARRSLVEAVQVAMRGGAVSGFLVVALSLLGVYGIFVAVRRPGAIRRPGAVPHRRLRLRRQLRRPLRPARRRHLHEGRRRRRRPRRQGRGRASPRTTRATRASSPTSSATTSATAPAAAPTSSSRRPPRTSAR